MKIPSALLFVFAVFNSSLSAQVLSTQTFEIGNDTSNWGSGSTWNSGVTASTFLSAGLGGLSAGAGDSSQQTFSRSFRNNTVGLNVETTAYTIGMYVQVDALGDGPQSGQFEVMDGTYGDNTAHLRVQSGGLAWQAFDGGSWVNLGINLQLSQPIMSSSPSIPRLSPIPPPCSA